MVEVVAVKRERHYYINTMAAYAANAAEMTLPDDVVEKAKYHILDTLCAMITGTTLSVGKMALSYSETLGETGASFVVGNGRQLHPADSALINGLLAHANETDDSHPAAIGHPGCAVVPAAMSVGFVKDVSGQALLRAVVLGYDYYARMNIALGSDHIYAKGHGPYSIGGSWGAAAAAGSLYGLSADEMVYVFSNVSHQTGGIAVWMRDKNHQEKAFHFAGLPARNGVSAASMIAHGFSGTDDVIEGRGNFMDAYSDAPDREILTGELGQRFEIMLTNIKKWCVGSPIQSALDSLEFLMAEEGVTKDNLEHLYIGMPTHVVDVVEDRSVPDINAKHCLALMLADGYFGFHPSHDYSRMEDPEVLGLKAKMTLAGAPELDDAKPIRQSIVTATLKDGRVVSKRTYSVRGVHENPMSREDVVRKAEDLLTPLLKERTSAFIASILDLENMQSINELRPYLTA